MDNYHITKNGKYWQLKKQGADRALIIADTKEEAIERTRKFMENKTGSVKIHREDGTLQEERTYQRKDDPKNSPG